MLTRDIYLAHLKVIGDISFTSREIDIISCLVSGRGAKKTASLLSIAPKTVENHTRNIMLKLGCCSYESVIDFIEQSGSLPHFRGYYSNLLFQLTLEIELRKIALKPETKSEKCLIVHYGELKDKSLLLGQLERHLILSGIKVTIESVRECKLANFPIDGQNSESPYFVLYTFSKIMMAELLVKQESENLTLSLLQDQYNKHKPGKALVLLEGDLNSGVFVDFLKEVEHITLSENCEYYLGLYTILEKILPSVNFEKSLAEVTRLYQSFNHSSSEQTRIKKMDEVEPELYLPLLLNSRSKKIKVFVTTIIGMLIVFGVGVLFFNEISQKIHEQLKSSTSHALNKEIPTLLSQMESGQSPAWYLPKAEPIFIGREKLLEKLNEHLVIDPKKSASRKQPHNLLLRVSVCAGLGGTGKTQLAIHYLNNTHKPYTLKAWFAAENTEQLQQKYIEFAKQIGFLEKRASIDSIINYVKRWLVANPGWIVVYDNVESYEEINNFLPESGGNVIITSRQRQWPQEFDVVHVDVMTEAESALFIKSILAKAHSETAMPETELEETKEIETLAKVLGYLPLALSQASAYIKQNQIRVSEYLDLYKKHQDELLNDATFPIGAHYHSSVTMTLDLSLSAIQKEMKSDPNLTIALDLLTVCAYLDPQKIPRNFLLNWLKKNYPELDSPDLVLTKIIGKLWHYSLIDHDGYGNIGMHRLMQATLRYRHPYRKDNAQVGPRALTLQWYNALLSAIHEEFLPDTQVLADEKREKSLLPHLLSLISHHDMLWPDHTSCQLAQVLRDVGVVLHLAAEAPAAAVPYYQRALDIMKQHYGNIHLETAKILNNLGHNYILLGNAKYAKELLTQSLKITADLGKADSRFSAIIESNLGQAYSALGDITSARELLTRGLKNIEKHYGAEHVRVILPLVELGVTYGDLGDARKKKQLLERALMIGEKHYGKNHVQIGNVLTELGDAYRSVGNEKYAKKILERALELIEQAYGKNHPEVAKALNHLGIVHRALGDFKSAKVLLIRALEIKNYHFPENHPEMAIGLASLGNIYGELGDIKEKQNYLERALKIEESYYGQDHPEVAKTLTNLGNAYRCLGNNKYAKDLLEKALLIKEQHYGKNHPEVSKTLLYLAEVYWDLGNFKQSQALQENVLKIREDYYGKNHYEVAKVLTRLSIVHGGLGKATIQKEFALRALKIQEEYYGKAHPEVANTLASLGYAYRVLGEVMLAKQVLLRALIINEEYYGKEHPQVALILNNMGNTHGEVGDHKQKRKLLERALEIQRKNYGTEHPEVARTLTNLGTVLLDLGNISIAKILLEEALDIKKKYYGENHPETAKTLASLGKVYVEITEVERGKALLEKALNIREQHYGECHHEVGRVLLNLANVDILLNNVKNAYYHSQKAYTIFLETYGRDHKYTKKAVELLTRVFLLKSGRRMTEGEIEVHI